MIPHQTEKVKPVRDVYILAGIPYDENHYTIIAVRTSEAGAKESAKAIVGNDTIYHWGQLKGGLSAYNEHLPISVMHIEPVWPEVNHTRYDALVIFKLPLYD